MARPRCTCPGEPFARVPGPFGKDDIQVDITTMMQMLGEGFITSLQIFALTLVGALPLGVVVVALRMCRFAPVRLIEDGTVEQIAAKYADQGLTMDNWQIK